MDISFTPIGFIHNCRLTIEDDSWGNILSTIELSEHLDHSSLNGIEAFSHLDIIFFFDKVDKQSIQYQSRNPRNNENYPSVGIFAQRGKNRPNRIGLTTVRLIEHSYRTLTVEGLDAVNGTPVLDIKPVFNEFLPKGKIKQPNWAVDLMKNYW